MPWDIRGPGSGAGGALAKDEHEGHLQIAIGAELRADTQTKFGVVDAALCRYWVCVEDDLVLKDYLLFGAALVPAVLQGGDAEIVIGRLVKGEAKSGQNAAWLLSFPDDDDIELAEKWLDAHAARMPSGRIEIEIVAPAPAPDKSEPF